MRPEGHEGTWPLAPTVRRSVQPLHPVQWLRVPASLPPRPPGNALPETRLVVTVSRGAASIQRAEAWNIAESPPMRTGWPAQQTTDLTCP